MKMFSRFSLFMLFVIFLCIPVSSFAAVSEEVDAEINAHIEQLNALQDQLTELNAQIEANGLDLGSMDDQEVVTEELKATVTEVLSDETDDMGNRQAVFRVRAGEEELTIDTSQSLLEGLRYGIKKGDRVYVQVIRVGEEVDQVFLVDVIRTGKLFWIALLFAIVIFAVGRWRGLMSLAGLGVTLLVLFGMIIPAILAGWDPVFVTVLAGVLILGVNMFSSHGLNRSTFLAFSSTVIGLVLVLIFAEAFVAFANLSGLASEEAILLQFQSEAIKLPTGILLAGIILGAVGVLDDIAITQGETVAELKKANHKLDRRELFVRAMRVGRHHIASTVNTLVLAYAGVALPLLLLFVANPDIGGMRFLNEEQVAEEIVRTLAGTMALVLTVPISTWLATYRNKR